MKTKVSQPFRSGVAAFLLLSTLLFSFAYWKSLDQKAFAEALPATEPADSVEKELEQIVHKQSEAWNKGDIAEFMNAYWNDERLTFSSSGKTQRGWKATYDNYKINYPDRETMGKLTFTELETQELSPTAMLMLGTWQLERASPVGGNFSLVWKRIDGKWLIVHDHTSALK